MSKRGSTSSNYFLNWKEINNTVNNVTLQSNTANIRNIGFNNTAYNTNTQAVVNTTNISN
jgi:hypothetical protein